MHCYWLPLPQERELVVGGATAPTMAMAPHPSPLPEERELVVGGATAPTLAMVSRGESFDLRGGVAAIEPSPQPPPLGRGSEWIAGPPAPPPPRSPFARH